MRATFIYGAGDVRVETAPDPVLQQAGDAIVRIVRACICGSDLHPYHSMPAQPEGRPMGHEFLGVVEETGSEVTTLEAGDFVIGPFTWSDGTCEFCREGLQTSCERGGFWGNGGTGGAQAEAIRVPLADGTLVAVLGSMRTMQCFRPCSPSPTPTAPATTPPSRRVSRGATRWPSSATVPSACWRSCPPGSSAPSGSS